MVRKEIRIHGINLRWVVLAVVYSFSFWAIYQDTKTELPWYYIALVCLLGTLFGLFIVIKIVDPTMRYMDNKIGKLFNIKE